MNGGGNRIRVDEVNDFRLDEGLYYFLGGYLAMKSPLRILKRMFCCFLVVVLVLETSGLLEVNSYAIDGMDISNVLISNINETPSGEEWLNSNEVKDIVTNEIDSTDDDLPNQETDSREDGQLPESHEDESGDNEDNSDNIDDVTGEEKEDISEVIEEDSEECVL